MNSRTGERGEASEMVEVSRRFSCSVVTEGRRTVGGKQRSDAHLVGRRFRRLVEEGRDDVAVMEREVEGRSASERRPGEAKGGQDSPDAGTEPDHGRDEHLLGLAARVAGDQAQREDERGLVCEGGRGGRGYQRLLATAKAERRGRDAQLLVR